MQPDPKPVLVDVDALTRNLVGELHHTCAKQLILGLEWCDDEPDGSMPVRYPQRIKLVEATLAAAHDGAGRIGELVDQAVDPSLRWKFNDDPDVQAVLRMKPR